MFVLVRKCYTIEHYSDDRENPNCRQSSQSATLRITSYHDSYELFSLHTTESRLDNARLQQLIGEVTWTPAEESTWLNVMAGASGLGEMKCIVIQLMLTCNPARPFPQPQREISNAILQGTDTSSPTKRRILPPFKKVGWRIQPNGTGYEDLDTFILS